MNKKQLLAADGGFILFSTGMRGNNHLSGQKFVKDLDSVESYLPIKAATFSAISRGHHLELVKMTQGGEELPLDIVPIETVPLYESTIRLLNNPTYTKCK